MKREKFKIKNREGKNIAVVLERVDKPKGLAFIMHGLGGFKDQLHIIAFSEAFLESNYNVVRFDACHTFGESEGKYEDATTTNYYEDLVDVINWVKSQNWYVEPFCLVGHSLGSISVALYAEKYPKEVRALAPTSTVVSGRLMIKIIPEKELEKYNKTGWKISESKSIPGVMKKLKWKPFMEDILKYDLIKDVNKLKMPVLLLVGEKDTSTPVEQQRMLYDKLPGKKEIYIIKGAEHTFREKEHLEEIKRIFKKWISKI